MRRNYRLKLAVLLLALALCLTLAACGSGSTTEDAAAPESVSEETAANAEGVLVEPPGDGPASRSAIAALNGVPMTTLNNGVQMPRLGLGTQIQRLEAGGPNDELTETSRQYHRHAQCH